MLVLTRKAEEKIVIGRNNNKIVITVLRIQGDKVSIGIKADRDTPIYRYELVQDSEKNQLDSLVKSLQVDLHEQELDKTELDTVLQQDSSP